MAERAGISAEKFDEICEIIKTTSHGTFRACRDVQVSSTDFYIYLNNHGEEARLKYARAKEIQCDVIAEHMIEIADDNSEDIMTIEKNGKEIELENREFQNRSRLRIDTRKWILSKLYPKKYGDKLEIDNKSVPEPLVVMTEKGEELFRILHKQKQEGKENG